MKRCCILRSLPGGGKDFWVRRLLSALETKGHFEICDWQDLQETGLVRIEVPAHEVKVVSADDFFMVANTMAPIRDPDVVHPEKVYKFDPALLGEAHKTCFQRFIFALGSDIPLVIANNTNVNSWEIAPYVAVAEAMNYEVTIVHIMAKVEDCVRRNVHGVPAHVIGAMSESLRREQLPGHWNLIKVKNDA